MLAKFSVKKPYTVIVAILLVIALGVISFIHMTTDLLPSMDLPYVIVYTTYTGATPEAVEADVTRPLEATFSTLTDVKNVSSTSSENLSLVVLEFEAGADMNTAMIEINSDIEQIRGGWDDAIGTPVIMKLNPDMLPVTISTVSLEGADLLELSDYVEDELVPRYEAVDGVARVSASGILTQQVDITIEQSRIDALNNAILREVDANLADVELQLRDARSQLASGKSQLASMRSRVFAQIDEALQAIDQGSSQLPVMTETLTQRREELVVTLAQARQMRDGLAALTNLGEAETAAINAAGAQMVELQSRREAKRAELEGAQGEGNDGLLRELQANQSALTEERALRDELSAFIASATILDRDALVRTADQLTISIAENEASYATARTEYETAVAERDAAQAEVDRLTALLGATASDASTEAPTEEPTQEPTAEPTEAPSEEPTADPSEEPAGDPTEEPTGDPTDAPTGDPTEEPTGDPTDAPTGDPSEEPAGDPTDAPTDVPTDAPTDPPSAGASQGADDSSSSADGDASDGGAQAPADPEASEERGGADMPAVQDVPAESAQDPAPESNAASDSAADPAPEQTALLTGGLFGVALAEEEPVYTEEELRQMLADAEARLALAEEDVNTKLARCDRLRETLNEQRSALDRAQETLRRLDAGEDLFQEDITAAQAQLDACNERIAALETRNIELYALLQGGSDRDRIMAELAALDQQIAALAASPAYQAFLLLNNPEAAGTPLEQQLAVAQGYVDSLETGIAQVDEMLDKVSRGILPGGLIPGMDEDVDLASARSQLVSARSQAASGFSQAAGMLSDAEAELAEAWNEFTENRDEALENAGIDGIITVQTISQILGSQNLDLPAGYVANADDRYLVSVGTEFASLQELQQVKLFSLGMETVDDVRLFDVARVEISDNSADLFTFVNGENGVMLSFEKQSTASTAEVAKNITAESEELMAENDRLLVTEMMNQGDYINLIVDSVLQNLLYGGGLAILVLLLFLMDWRPTLIVAISIPASVVVAFVCMYFTGITLNVMSLSGLALGVGMLVDNSIVSIENIYRLRDEEGLPILTASIRGVNQVAGALFASTLTTICVFLPVIFVEGMARDLFTDMGLTIAFSLLASLVVAMTVVPSAAATLFKKKKERKQRIFGAVQRGYVAMLRGALKVKPLVLLAALALLVYSGYQVLDMGISFMPSVNSEQMSASLEFADPDMPDSEREAAAISIMGEIMQVEGVKDVSLSGSSALSLMGGGSGYTYYVLVDTELGRKNAEIAADMQSRAAAYADGERAVFSTQVSTMDLSIFAGEGITVDITGDDIQALRDASTEVAAICAQVDGAINVDDGSEEAEPKLAIIVDKELASDNSLSVAQVYQYVAQRLYGAAELTDATLDGREYTLYVNADENIDLAPDDIADMEIEVAGTTETHFVRIGDIATIVDGESLASIRRDNQRRTTSVSFEVAEGYSANLVSRDLEERLAAYQPPEGVSISLSGENETVMGYMKDLLTMLGIAVLFIFLIMVAQFQSFKSPIIVMFTIPLAFTGGLLALLITHMDLSIIAMVGFLVLSGVVVNNGIVFIDSVNQMRINGMEKREALIETGRIRLRPILMTALTTILGMSTMAMAKGMGAEMMQPMAVVTIGGLSYATLMTLFVVPVLYDLLNGKKMKAREIEMMKEAAGMQREGFEDGPAARPVAEAVTEPLAAEAEAVSEPEPEQPVAEAEPVMEPEPEPSEGPAKPVEPMRVRIWF